MVNSSIFTGGNLKLIQSEPKESNFSDYRIVKIGGGYIPIAPFYLDVD